MNDNLIMLVKFDKETGSTTKSTLADQVRKIESYISIGETGLYSFGEAFTFMPELDLPF